MTRWRGDESFESIFCHAIVAFDASKCQVLALRRANEDAHFPEGLFDAKRSLALQLDWTALGA